MDLSLGSRSRRFAVFVMVMMLVLSLGTGVVAAQSFQGASGTVVVEEGETYDGISGISGSIIISGTVTGDVSGVSGQIHVTETGVVEGSIEAAAGTVLIDGRVDGDVSAGAGHVEVSETGEIGDDFDVGTGFLRVDGRVGGDVRAGAATIELGPNTDVGGEFRYDAGSFTQDSGATVAGGVVQDSSLGDGFGVTTDLSPMSSTLATIYGLFASLLLGAVLLAAFPSFSRGVATRVARTPVTAGGVGFLTLIAVPIVLVILAITIVGIPLSVGGAIVFGIGIWVAVVYGQYAVAAWLLGLAGADNRWLALVVGLVGFTILGAIPFVGSLLEFFALLLGLGAITLGLREGYRSRRERRTEGQQTTLSEAAGDTSGSGASE